MSTLFDSAPHRDLESPPFVPEQHLEFQYPKHNFHGVGTPLETRRIRVTDVRDLVARPLDPITAQQQPLLRRDRWLITGIDLEHGQERSFYLGSMVGPVELQPTG